MRVRGERREVLWEEAGPDFDGRGDCAPGWTGPLSGAFATCSFRTQTIELPPLPVKAAPTEAFCLLTDWSAYRTAVTTLRCFDLRDPSAPILEAGVTSLTGITPAADGALQLRGVGVPGMAVLGPYEIEYRWDPERKAFLAKEVRALEGGVRQR